MKMTGAVLYFVSFFTLVVVEHVLGNGMLQPRESESRQIQELNGMWNFRADMSPNRNAGFEKLWYQRPLARSGHVIPMPVPSSYNDITTDKKLQYFVGWVWYDREFFVSSDWRNRRIVLRLDSAHYYSKVWVNGKLVVEHDGGHLPFEAQVNDVIDFAGPNRVTVAINNTLTPYTIPPGTIQYKSEAQGYPPGYFVQNLQFDFFNYAGIHRKVRLYTTPKTYIDDITVTTGLSGTTGLVNYQIIKGGNDDALVRVEVVDKNGVVTAQGQGNSGTIKVHNANLWWPYTMKRQDFAYMYTLRVALQSDKNVSDIYYLPFGIRTINVTEVQVLINGKPFYCQGVAKHEDSDIRGKGLDFPLIARDFNMLKWLGANCFRTSHYPYAEEILDQADLQGIAVIDESPGVGLKTDENFSNRTLAHHLDVMKEMVRRDKNRPSVIMWSVANEPSSGKQVAGYYFKTLIEFTKRLDRTRPVTFVSASDYNSDKAAKYTDVQCINRYYGWYEDTGHTETIKYKLRHDLQKWFETLRKPLMITEYGADTVAGLHTEPSFIFTEEFQVEFLREYHHVFDDLRKQFLAGEMVWNFADFMTDQSVTRVVGNRKGLLTRQRQPKASGHLLRARYWSIINGTIPLDRHSNSLCL